MQQRRKMTMSARQYIGPKVKNDFKMAGISHWNHNGTKLNNALPNPPNHNGMSKKYKDLDIRVRNTAPKAAASTTASNGLTISRINNIKRRAEASPLRPIMQNQQIINNRDTYKIIRPDRDETQ